MRKKVWLGRGKRKKSVNGIPSWHSVYCLLRSNKLRMDYLVTEFPIDLSEGEIAALRFSVEQGRRIVRTVGRTSSREAVNALSILAEHAPKVSDREKGYNVYMGPDYGDLGRASDVVLSRQEKGIVNIGFVFSDVNHKIILGKRRSVVIGGVNYPLSRLEHERYD